MASSGASQPIEVPASAAEVAAGNGAVATPAARVTKNGHGIRA